MRVNRSPPRRPPDDAAQVESLGQRIASWGLCGTGLFTGLITLVGVARLGRGHPGASLGHALLLTGGFGAWTLLAICLWQPTRDTGAWAALGAGRQALCFLVALPALVNIVLLLVAAVYTEAWAGPGRRGDDQSDRTQPP